MHADQGRNEIYEKLGCFCFGKFRFRKIFQFRINFDLFLQFRSSSDMDSSSILLVLEIFSWPTEGWGNVFGTEPEGLIV